MAGGIWEAIGQALQAGGQTYNTVSNQQRAQKEDAIRLKMAQDEQARQAAFQDQQLGMERERLNMAKSADARRIQQEDEDRKLKILQTAIADADPNTAFTPEEFDFAKSHGLGARFKEMPSVDAMPGGNMPTPESTARANFGSLQGPVGLPRMVADLAPQAGGIKRQFTPEEQVKDAQQNMLLNIYQSLNGGNATPATPGATPSPAVPALSPDQKKRIALGAAGVDSNKILGPPQQNPFEGVATGEDVLKGLSPMEAQAVKKLASYELPIASGNMRSPQMLRLMALAAAYDPSFDSTQYTARQKVRNDFTSGGVANNIQSLNTVLNHMAKLSDAADKLNNFSSPLINAPVNAFEQHVMGDTRPTNYNVIADAVAAEAAKVFKGGINAAPAEKEIAEWRRNLSPNLSPEQFQGAMQSLASLLQGRETEIQTRWSNAFGDKPLPFVLPSITARGSLEKMGMPVQSELPNGISVVGGGAEAPAMPPQLTADKINAYARQRGLDPKVAAAQLMTEWNQKYGKPAR